MSINRLIISIKTAGLNHKQINQVLIGDLPEQTNDLSYPLLRIWPSNVLLSNDKNDRYKRFQFVIAVMDRHLDNPISQIEAISDSEQILTDIVSTLHYIYRDEQVNWFVQDSLEPFYDSAPDKVAGYGLTIEARYPFNQDFCQVPSNDFDFPAIGLFNYNVIDEGNSATTYQPSYIING